MLMERGRGGEGSDGWMDAGIQRQSGSGCGGACFHGNLPVKGVGWGSWVGVGGWMSLYVCMYVCNMVGQVGLSSCLAEKN